MLQQPSEITQLLNKMGAGEIDAKERLFQIVYKELRKLARNAMRGERNGHTLQPTALVHEAFIRLTGGVPIRWVDRGHFFTVAARTMRRILVDYANQLHAKKRWGGQRVDLTDRLLFDQGKAESLLALEQALERLDQIAPRRCRIVELRYFAGLELEEIASALDISGKTVQREWAIARAWLHAEMSQPAVPG